MIGNNSITLLNHTDSEIAERIYQLFQASYSVEAKLLKIKDFPPLKKSTINIQSSKTQFWGYYNNVAIAEISITANHILSIHSFVVSPSYFRQGIGSKLLSDVLELLKWETAVVETGAKNHPAILLYKKFGFIEKKQWVNKEGIEKTMLTLKL